MELIVGTPQDHEARYQDYIQTPEGLLHHRRVYLSHLFKVGFSFYGFFLNL